MRAKINLLFRLAKRAARRIIHLDFSYQEKNVFILAWFALTYLLRNGPKAFIVKLKQTMVKIDRRLGNNLYFPNGLISGVEYGTVVSWYRKKAHPVTIVIPSYNDLEVLKPCIDSIAQTTNPELVKVLVVDDYCQPENAKNLKSLESEQVKVIFREKNGGFAKAVNTGLKAAPATDDVILVNSDIFAHEHWLESLQYAAYEFGEKIGIVGPKLLYPDGKIQSAGSFRNTESPQWFDHYYRFQDSNYGPANIPQYCISVTGACMYIKREVIKKIGILDDKFQFAFEDTDYCLRAWEAGYKSLYFPVSTLTHAEGHSRPKHDNISPKEKQSIKYFWQKWGDWFDKRNVLTKEGKIKIIFVLQSFGYSGGIKNVFEQANRLSERDFDIEVWGIDHKQPVWPINDKVKIVTFKNYKDLIKELTPVEAIKVATWWETAFPVWISSIATGRPVYFVQEFESWFYPDDVVAQSTVVACYRKEFTNLTISSYNQGELRAIGLDATLLPCGYEDSIFRQIDNVKREDNVLLALGRSFFQKNFDMTLKGWQLLGAKRPKMWLYGSEPEMAKLDDRIKYFTKPNDGRVNELFNKATLFVQTSRHEGFSIPILEAMATGCPVICTDAHGNRDFCFNNKNCLMIEHDDAIGLKKAIDKLLDDPGLRSSLSKAGLKTAVKYKWPVIIDQAEDFYRKVARA